MTLGEPLNLPELTRKVGVLTVLPHSSRGQSKVARANAENSWGMPSATELQL